MFLKEALLGGLNELGVIFTPTNSIISITKSSGFLSAYYMKVSKTFIPRAPHLN